MRRELSAPGNVLLLGEYAVTEPGGLGVALGSGPRGSATSQPAKELTVTSRFGSGFLQWPSDPLPLMDVALETLENEGIEPEPQQLEIDTSSFYEGERKLGFGSSAVATVMLVAQLLPGGADLRTHAGRERLFGLALQTHRALQGGRGSGYDVAASIWGGLLRFEGGSRPAVKRVELPCLPRLYALCGREAVHSGRAVDAYNRWKHNHPREAEAFIEQSNELVGQLLASERWEEGARVLEKASRLGEELGRTIGVESSFRPLESQAAQDALLCDRGPAVLKSAGAGAEMGVLFTPCEMADVEPESIILETREEGVRWE